MYENMSDEELEEAITEKYGDGWNAKTLNDEDPLCLEYLNRLDVGE